MMKVKDKKEGARLKIYFRLTNPCGGANTLIDNLIKYLNNKEIEYILDYLPGFPEIMPAFYPFFKNKGQDCNLVHKDAFTSFYANSKPSLITVYHLPETPYYQKYASLMQKLYYKIVYLYHHRALKNTNVVVCTSQYTKKQLEIIHGYKKAVVIYCGVDTNLFRPMKVKKEKFGINKEKTILIYTGNLIKRKGADLLPEIMKKLGNNFVLLMTAGMRNQTIKKGKNIIFLGRFPFKKLVEVYSVSDILVFPTRLEGFGYTVAEAMACGKPVVTTNCSSLPELIIDGKGGFLCEIDNVDDFVEKIRILARDENLRKRMGIFNRKRILENFTLDVMGKKYVNLYKKLVK